MATPEAKLIATRGNCEVRRATRKNQCWPGWARPLGFVGYWYGTRDYHVHFATLDELNAWFDSVGAERVQE